MNQALCIVSLLCGTEHRSLQPPSAVVGIQTKPLTTHMACMLAMANVGRKGLVCMLAMANVGCKGLVCMLAMANIGQCQHTN